MLAVFVFLVACASAQFINNAELTCPENEICNMCVCKDGYRRDEQGYCVKEEDEPCGDPYEVRGQSCDNELSCEHGVLERSPCWTTGCQCIDGTARDAGGNCVLTDKCCYDTNEEFGYDSTDCPATCIDKHPDCGSSPRPGCQCKKEFVRVSTDNKTCVRESECGYNYDKPSIPFDYLPPY